MKEIKAKKRKSKEDKEKEKALLEEVVRQRELVKTSIYPLILKHNKTIKDAINMCKSITVGMDNIFMNKMKEYSTYASEDKLETLKLLENMSTEDQYAGERELVTLLNTEKVKDAKGLIEGMQKELERLIDKEMSERPLETLKTEFL